MKSFILTLTFISVFCTLVLADCYSAWSQSFDTATSNLKKDQERCGLAKYKSMCFAEADSYYNTAINTAGDTYYHCVL